MKIFCWIVTLLMSVFSFLMLAKALMIPDISAPQLAAEAAVSATMVIIPYVFTRAVEGFYRASETAEEQNEDILIQLRMLNENLKKGV
jgi:hypothetical protein